MKDLIVSVSGLFGKRFTTRQKDKFIHYMQVRATENGTKYSLKCEKQGIRQCRNIHLGDLKQARVILAVPYDTGSRILWPGIKYYPLQAKKNAWMDSISKVLDILLILLIFLGYYITLLKKDISLPVLAGAIILILTSGKFLLGWGNSNNYSRNSASIVVALECQKRLGPEQLAVVLLDHSCCGFGGYQQLADFLKKKRLQKKVIILDCIASGTELHLHTSAPISQLPNVQIHHIDEQQRGQSTIELFSDCTILTGGKQVGGVTVINGTRSPKDNQIDLEKLAMTVQAVITLANQ